MKCSSEGSYVEDNGGGACGGMVEEEVQRVLLRLNNGFGVIVLVFLCELSVGWWRRDFGIVHFDQCWLGGNFMY